MAEEGQIESAQGESCEPEAEDEDEGRWGWAQAAEAFAAAEEGLEEEGEGAEEDGSEDGDGEEFVVWGHQECWFWRMRTPLMTSPMVRRELREASGIWMLKSSSTSKERLILSSESMPSSSKDVAGVRVAGSRDLEAAMSWMIWSSTFGANVFGQDRFGADVFGADIGKFYSVGVVWSGAEGGLKDWLSDVDNLSP